MAKNLKLIANDMDMVPVYMTDTCEKVVYGTELHAALGVKSKFADWAKNRFKDCDAIENEDFQGFSKILEKGGRPQTEYIIKLDTAKEMAMLERNDKGKQVRRYFIRIEEKYKNQGFPMDTGSQIRLIAQGYTELEQKFDTVEQRVGELEGNMTIDYGQQRALGEAVGRSVLRALGGKGSNAYAKIAKKVFSECNRDLKGRFNVNARNNVPKLRYDEAVGFAESWAPCTDTQMMIQGYNAQVD